MANDFSRTLSLLRQEKGVSQRKAAAELGISQALLSHYENGIREPGLAFVVKVCSYYHVSADYLLGRTLSRDGAMIDADDLYDSSMEKGTLKGSILATLQKKLVVNTASLLFDALGKLGNREAITAAGDYLSAGLYQILRALYRRSGANEEYFSIDHEVYDAGAVSADMELSKLRYLCALNDSVKKGEEFPALDAENLSANYPGLSQSAAQVFHNVDERCRTLTENH
ncbi:MAG: helix-turn-helix transcriptional regulator [Ruminococcaceae bacterium]|nr:helix-turn-helix transcriptional regulator [Oscillospiraceae bacterium]